MITLLCTGLHVELADDERGPRRPAAGVRPTGPLPPPPPPADFPPRPSMAPNAPADVPADVPAAEDDGTGPAPWGFQSDPSREGDVRQHAVPTSVRPVIASVSYEWETKAWVFPGEPPEPPLEADHGDRPDGTMAPPEPDGPPPVPRPRGSLGAALGLKFCGFRPSMADDEHQKKRRRQTVPWMCIVYILILHVYSKQECFT